jgi:hypothetical protein
MGLGTSAPGGLLELSSDASGTLAGEVLLQRIRSNTAVNYTFVDVKSRRHTAGSDWTGLGFRLQHQVDGTPMGFLEFNSLVGGQDVAIGTGGSTRLLVNSSGNVGIGTTSPTQLLDIVGNSNASIGSRIRNDSTGASAQSVLTYSAAGRDVSYAVNYSGQFASETGSGITSKYTNFDTHIWRSNAGTERARIDSSGRLLVGTSTGRSNFFNSTNTAGFQFEGQGGFAAFTRTDNDIFGAGAVFAKTRSSGNTIVQNNDTVGILSFQGSDGSEFVECANIQAIVDGTPGADDMPGRLVFSTTADGASSPTERMRIKQGGSVKISNSGSYHDVNTEFHEIRQTTNQPGVVITSTEASFTNNTIHASSTRAANSAFSLVKLETGVFSDIEFNLRGDGNAFADGTWTGGGADYAEYFEWSDSNPNTEDRRGISVVLDGDKIREAQVGEDPIGVISGNPSIVGDAAWNKWNGKYLRDEFGTYIQEDYEVEDEDGNTVIQQRRKLNPAYDPDVEYVSRENRPEWDCVGLMGKLRISKGQVTGSRWIKMRDINDSVEEWLVR